MAKNIFISTAIPYVNASPHVGFAFEIVLADILARFERARGNNVFFMGGTDENALKNVQAAEKAGVPIREFVDSNAERFKRLGEALDISYDCFFRTSVDPRHARGAQKLWASVRREDIYKKKYKGAYCVGCEEFKTGKDFVNGECPEHPGKKIEDAEEENYFFKLSNYQKLIDGLIRSDKLTIIPSSRKNETLAFIKRGLEDLSISRSVERASGWGVPVPGDESQMQYVWFDALSNYINALGYPDDDPTFETYWQNADRIIHVIGKGINRFHTIYWPAILTSANLRTPDMVFIHGYVTAGGQKMSKSVGNVVDPMEIIEEYGSDALRYYLGREITPFEDGDFTAERFRDAYNANLANGLGNLTSRIMKMAISYDIKATEMTRALTREEHYHGVNNEYLENFEVNRAMDEIWNNRIQNLDAYIQKEQPFKKIKEDEEGAKSDIEYLLFHLRGIAFSLYPFMPETAKKIDDAIMNHAMPKALFPRK